MQGREGANRHTQHGRKANRHHGVSPRHSCKKDRHRPVTDQQVPDGVGKRDPQAGLEGLHKGAASAESSVEVPQDTDTRSTSGPSHSAAGYCSEKNLKC